METNYSICSHFEKGSTHLICQDYAAHNKSVAVLCDGCSSSENTDVGARVLANLVLNNPQITHTALAHEAFNIVKLMGLNESCLDATVLWFEIAETEIKYHMWGDGLLIAKYANYTHSLEINYPTNAPYYVSYMLNSRYREYTRAFGLPQAIAVESGRADRQIYPYLSGTLTRNQLQWLCMFSDGINTFPQGREEILPQLTDFKSLNGEFVKRRMSKVFKKLENKCHDDLACIGFSKPQI